MGENDPNNFLEELHKEKKEIEKYIKKLEDSIIDNETKYLTKTANNGNILRGWEHIFTSKPNKLYMGTQIKKAHISNNEKLFSQTFIFLEEELDNENKYIIINSNDKNINKNDLNNISDENGNTNKNAPNKKRTKSFKNFVGVKRKGNSMKPILHKHNVNQEEKLSS